MNSIKCFLTISLLIFSGQSMALFMPADFQIKSSNEPVLSDDDC